MESAKATFSGGVAVITGAGSGIGEGIARQAAALGMKVVLADVAKARIDAVAKDIEAQGGIALAVVTDVSDPTALDRLAEVTHSTFGDVQLLINNAGIETLGFTWELSAQAWEKILNVNIHGVIHGVRAFVPAMITSGKPAYIANVASIGALGMMPIQTSYVLSKHAVLSFTESLYLEMELKQAPIQVSVIMPGPVSTRIFHDSQVIPDPLIAHHQAAMRTMLEQAGISGTEAAKRILTQIAAGEFWVSTHPDITAAMAKGRAQHLSGMQRPVLAAEVKPSIELP